MLAPWQQSPRGAVLPQLWHAPRLFCLFSLFLFQRHRCWRGHQGVHHGADPRDPGAARVSRYPRREQRKRSHRNTVTRQPPRLVQGSSATSATQNTKARFNQTPGEGDAIRARSSLLPERWFLTDSSRQPPGCPPTQHCPAPAPGSPGPRTMHRHTVPVCYGSLQLQRKMPAQMCWALRFSLGPETLFLPQHLFLLLSLHMDSPTLGVI